MFQIDITPRERDVLIDHFNRLLREEAKKGRIVDRQIVIDCLSGLKLLSEASPTSSEPETIE